MVMENSIFVLKQQDYCSVGYAIRQQKISGSLIRDSYLFNQKIGSKRIEKSLYSVPADYKSAGTIVLLVYVRRHWKIS